MQKSKLSIIEANGNNFRQFGYLIQKPAGEPDIENQYVRLWHDIVPFNLFSDDQCIGYFETKKVPPVCTVLESIIHNAEAYVSLGDSRLVLFVALPKNEKEPDESTVRAYLFQAGQSVIIKKGVWHWSPYPLDSDNPFLLMLGKSNLISTDKGLEGDPKEIVVVNLDKEYEAIF
jgi:ureidoglycolate lyase